MRGKRRKCKPGNTKSTKGTNEMTTGRKSRLIFIKHKSENTAWLAGHSHLLIKLHNSVELSITTEKNDMRIKTAKRWILKRSITKFLLSCLIKHFI